MTRFIYINGRYQPYRQAVILVEDRGFQFGDSVYVVCAYHRGHFIDFDAHIDKLQHYTQTIGFDLPFGQSTFKAICQEVIRRNHVSQAALYIQLTRGIASRVHWFPTTKIQPTTVIMANPWRFDFDLDQLDATAVSVMTTPDIRWRYSSIKTNAALANVLLRQQARIGGHFESWLVDQQGYIREGASSNAYIVDDQGIVYTHPADGTLVPGVTRQRLLSLLQADGITIIEQPFTVDQARTSAEAFLSGATSLIKPVIAIDQQRIGQGCAGPVTQRIAQLYYDYCLNQT